MDFNTWLDKAWTDHADDTAGVAARLLAEGPALAQSADDVAALARIAQHVYGEHLGQYEAGRALLAQLATHPQGSGAAPTLRVLDASLVLCAGGTDPRPGLEVPERIRVTAVAAGNLAERDARRAAALLQEAVADAETAGLADTDPACRALAVTGNNMACALEAKAPRSDDERALMIFAARTARQYWARAGTWLETERAEYRLARTFLAAGDVAEARRHAQACIEIVREHESPALEAFFGWEALGLVERAAGNEPGTHTRSKKRARHLRGSTPATATGARRVSMRSSRPARALSATPQAHRSPAQRARHRRPGARPRRAGVPAPATVKDGVDAGAGPAARPASSMNKGAIRIVSSRLILCWMRIRPDPDSRWPPGMALRRGLRRPDIAGRRRMRQRDFTRFER